MTLDEIKEKYKNDADLFVWDGRNSIDVSRIVVNKDKRNQGIGTAIMNDIIAYAKSVNKPVSLSPSKDFGGKIGKLREFYGNLGFKPNKGRHKDFTISNSMIKPVTESNMNQLRTFIESFSNENELLISTIIEGLDAVTEDQPFDVKTFKTLPSFAARTRYARSTLPLISNAGSSRIVFDLGGDKVLKLAKNAKGIAQNGVENDGYVQQCGVAANVYDADDEDLWIICDKLDNVTQKEFEQLLGIPFKFYCDAIMTNEANVRGTRSVWHNKLTHEQMQPLWDNEFICGIFDLMGSMDVLGGDLTKLNSYGKCKGELKLRDAGFTKTVAKEHYSNKGKFEAVDGAKYRFEEVPLEKSDYKHKIWEWLQTHKADLSQAEIEKFRSASEALRESNQIEVPEVMQLFTEYDIPLPEKQYRNVQLEPVPEIPLDEQFTSTYSDELEKIKDAKSEHRGRIPKFRGITPEKIKKTLKGTAGRSSLGDREMRIQLDKFDNIEDLKNHIYYHGTGTSVRGLRAGGSLSKNAFRGGGYEDMLHSISLSKDKNLASNFTGDSKYGNVYPVLLKKNARVLNMEGKVKDSNELEDFMPKLWEHNIDAVWIGGGEQELAVLNPKVLVQGKGESFAVFNKQKFTNDDIEKFAEQYGKSFNGTKLESVEHQEYLIGGRADGMTPEDIARKHGLPIEDIEEQLELGDDVEKEHSHNQKESHEIAVDHVSEIPDYYTRLNKMEKQAGITEGQVSSGGDLNSIADSLASRMKCDAFGNCVHFAEEFVLAVNKINPKLLKDFYVIEGYVDTPIGDGIPQQHTWIETKSGDKIDPTFIQFGERSYYSNKKARKFSGSTYLKDTIDGTWFSEKRKRLPDVVWKTITEGQGWYPPANKPKLNVNDMSNRDKTIFAIMSMFKAMSPKHKQEFLKNVEGVTKWQLDKYPDNYLIRIKMDAEHLRDIEKDMIRKPTKQPSDKQLEQMDKYNRQETKKYDDEFQEWRKIALDKGEIDQDGNFLK